MPKSLLDYAYDYLSNQKEPVNFNVIWNYIVEQAGLTEEEAAKKVSRLYTNLMLDGRFITLGENKWDLKTRHEFKEWHIDIRDVYNDVETQNDDQEEAQELAEEDKCFEEPQAESESEDEVATNDESESEF